jgi:hypothetical protein
MSEREVELTDEERARLDASLKASRNNAYGRLQRLSSTVESIVAARLADAEARAEAAVREFVQWVATSRAYNGSDHHVYAQSLYNDQINDALPKWAEEWFREVLRGDQ